MQISLPPEKIESVLALCKKNLVCKELKIKFLAKVIGVLVSCLPAVKNADLYYRCLESNKIKALAKSKGEFDSNTTLDVEALSEVTWWQNNVNVAKPVLSAPPELIITTDASMLGWGAVYKQQSSGGQWTTEETGMHINVLELKAMFLI